MTGQDRKRQDKISQDGRGHDRMGQDKTLLDNWWQNRIRQVEIGEDRTGQENKWKGKKKMRLFWSLIGEIHLLQQLKSPRQGGKCEWMFDKNET